MKRVNFKNSMVALAIVLVMVSCGGGSGNKQADSKKDAVEAATELVGKAESKGVTVDNWQEFVKKEFGVNFSVPDGWKFSQVNALSLSETNVTLLITFEKAGDNASAVSATAKALFDQTKALSSDGIFLIDVDINSGAMKKGQTFATFEERFKPTLMYDGISDMETYWYYKVSDVIKLVDISTEKGYMRVKFDYDKQIKL